MPELTKRPRAIRERAEKGATMGELARGANPNMVQVINAHNEQPYLLDIADVAEREELLERQLEDAEWPSTRGILRDAIQRTKIERNAALTRYREWQEKQE